MQQLAELSSILFAYGELGSGGLQSDDGVM